MARAAALSAATVVHLAWARVLMVLAGQEDVVFGTVLLGRMNAGAGADRVPGLYMNTLPVRVRSADTGVAAALTALRSQLAGLLAHEHAPLVLAQQASGVPAGLPLFTTLLNYRHSRPRGARTPDARAQGTGIAIIGGQERTNYPLGVSVDDTGTGFGIAVSAVAPADPEQVCALLGTCLDNLVTALDAAPATPLHTVPVLEEAQRSQLVDGWNDTAAPAGVTVPELIAAQATRTPDAVRWSARRGGQLRGAGGAGREAGPVPGLPGCGSGAGDRVVPGAGRGDGHRDPRDLAGGLGVPAAGPRLSASPAGPDAGRQPGPAPGMPRRSAGRAGRARRSDCDRPGRAGYSRAAGRAAGPRPRGAAGGRVSWRM